MLEPVKNDCSLEDDEFANFFTKLSSFQYLFNNYNQQDELKTSLNQQQKILMNAPLLRLHMDVSGKQMNLTN